MPFRAEFRGVDGATAVPREQVVPAARRRPAAAAASANGGEAEERRRRGWGRIRGCWRR